MEPESVVGDAEPDASSPLDKVDVWEDTDQLPPVANDDEFGVRAGVSTRLNVVWNDEDPNGDLLTVSLVGESPSVGQVQVVQDGRAFQVAVPEGATGSGSFMYEVADGRGGTDRATVRLTVVAGGANSSPEMTTSTPVVRVAAGASVKFDVLEGWRDPDGDMLYLQDARLDDTEEGDVLRFGPDGVVEFQDSGTVTDVIKTVAVRVSDGESSADGLVSFEVGPAGVWPPVVNGDHAVGVVGGDVLVDVLLNDTDPDGGQLRLVSLETDPRLTQVSVAGDSTVVWRAAEPLTAYLRYTVANNNGTAMGWVRVDVVAVPAGGSGLPPAPVADRALVQAGGSELVNVLWNDTDPDGGVLVLVGATSTNPSVVGVSVVEHTTLQVSDLVGGFDEPVRVSYEVANSNGVSEGQVTVLPVAPAEVRSPPVAVDDRVVVRAGDIVTVFPLANDYHPDDLPFELVEGSATKLDESQAGLLFTWSDRVRFHAGGEPGLVRVSYQVTDNQNDPVTGVIEIQVLPVAAESNQAPVPRPVEGATVYGGAVHIAVPLDGIDPDGDYTVWVGVGTPPECGTVSYAAGVLTYVADVSPVGCGTDRFTYLVQDRWGAQGEGLAVVGLAEPAKVNRPPVPVDYQVFVRPGRLVGVNPRRDVTDPDGDTDITLVSATAVSEGLGEVGLDDTKSWVVFRAPDQPGFYALSYVVADSFGAQASGSITVRVGEDAPLLAPLPQDDVVSVEQALAAANGAGVVEVELLSNDSDPDGLVSQAQVTIDSDLVEWDGTVARVPVTGEWQVVDYSLTDIDGLVGRAFIVVPGVEVVAPVVLTGDSLDPSVGVLQVEAGQTVTVALADVIGVRPGRSPQVVGETVTVRRGTGRVVDAGTLEYTAPPQAGNDAITLQVTDDPGAEGLVATVSIPVTVTPAPDQEDPEDETPGELALELVGGELQVEPGDAATLDLARYARVSLPEAVVTFSLGSGGSVTGLGGVTASMDGTVLTVRAASDVALGRGRVTVTATAVASGVEAPVSASAEVTVTVVASRRQAPGPQPDVVAAGVKQGGTVLVPVLDNDFNPFPETPLVVTGVVLTGGAAQVEVVGDQVRVSPAGDFTGVVTARYTVRDAAGREASALITVTVLGVPDRPVGLSVEQKGDQFVVLRWVVPANNGSPIERYEVTGTPAFSQTCASNVCTLTGLTNDVEYTFTVVAWNGVGPSEPSGPSVPARPDKLPNTPAAPKVEWGDGWVMAYPVDPGSGGSPVTSFDVQLDPPPPTGQATQRGVTSNVVYWSGVSNGTSYRARVCAKNKAVESCDGDESLWGPWSDVVIPAGTPRVTDVSLTDTGTTNGDGWPIYRLCWTTNENGRPVTGYTVFENGGAAVASGSGNPGCVEFAVKPSEQTHSYDVSLRNEIGWGPYSREVTVRVVTAPGAVYPLSFTDRCDGCAILGFTPGSTGGHASYELSYHYRVVQTGATGTIAPGGGTVPGLMNGMCYSIEVWTEGNVGGQVRSSWVATASDVCPYWQPSPPPKLWASSDDGLVTFTWDAANGNGRPVVNYRITVSTNGAAATHDLIAQRTSWEEPNLGYSQTVCLEVVTVTTWGSSSPTSVCGTSAPAPAPYLELWQSTFTDSPRVGLAWGNLQPGTYSMWASVQTDGGTVAGEFGPVDGCTISGGSASCSLAASGSVTFPVEAEEGDNITFYLSGPSGTVSSNAISIHIR
ncbi:MAG: tandem-95 repeat protein [Bifidobacteriaceae bacterium]|nr:tandem-95 repeat protein [Bifidobacteriaceae bacterium]